MIRAMIFDLDGTTADTAPGILGAIDLALSEGGYPPITMEYLLTFLSGTMEEYASHALPLEAARDPAIFRRFCEAYPRCYGQTFIHSVLYPGIADTLAALAKRIPLGMCSNKYDPYVHAVNRKLLPEGTFTFELGVGNGIPSKPDPTGALLVAEKLGVPPSECAFVGDSEYDIKTARAASMIPVSVSWGYCTREHLLRHGATTILSSPEELLRFI